MKLKALFTDEEAVSPVIGVILMVAITVILAAVIGTFVLGIGQNQQTTPNATWDFDYEASTTTVTFAHTGGDKFNSENTGKLTVNATGGSSSDLTGDMPISSGYSNSISAASGETVRIIWESPGGGKTQTVGSFNVP